MGAPCGLTPDLQALIHAWPTLPEALRAGVLLEKGVPPNWRRDGRDCSRWNARQ